MHIIRAILVALIAFSVATLPVAGGTARALSHNAMLTAPMADCCPQGKPCEKPTNDCGSMAGCALKCPTFTAAPVTPQVTAFGVLISERPAFLRNSFRSPSEHPPLPPPRV
jgi:hypothetical protein